MFGTTCAQKQNLRFVLYVSHKIDVGTFAGHVIRPDRTYDVAMDFTPINKKRREEAKAPSSFVAFGGGGHALGGSAKSKGKEKDSSPASNKTSPASAGSWVKVDAGKDVGKDADTAADTANVAAVEEVEFSIEGGARTHEDAAADDLDTGDVDLGEGQWRCGACTLARHDSAEDFCRLKARRTAQP